MTVTQPQASKQNCCRDRCRDIRTNAMLTAAIPATAATDLLGTLAFCCPSLCAPDLVAMHCTRIGDNLCTGSLCCCQLHNLVVRCIIKRPCIHTIDAAVMFLAGTESGTIRALWLGRDSCGMSINTSAPSYDGEVKMSSCSS